MAVAAEGSPHAVSYVYVVGGEDYVFREIKRRLLKLGVNVVGHASYRWKNARFEVGKLATAILVVTDECRNDMRAWAHEEGKHWEIPVIEAPAREHWPHAEEALRKYGVIEALAGVVPIVAPAPAALPPAPKTTLGEALAAKGEKLEPTPEPKKEPPAMPAAMPKSAPTTSKQDAQRELAVKLLRECKGKVGDTPIAQIVTKQTGTNCTFYLVRKVRRAERIPPARPGALSPEQIAFFQKYGIKTNQAAQGEKREPYAKTAAKPVKLAARARPAAVERAAPGEGSDEALADAFRQAVRHIDETLVQRFHLTSLTLRLENGTWQAPEFERVAVTRGTVKLR